MWYVRLTLIINGAKNIPVKTDAITLPRWKPPMVTVVLPCRITAWGATIVHPFPVIKIIRHFPKLYEQLLFVLFLLQNKKKTVIIVCNRGVRLLRYALSWKLILPCSLQSGCLAVKCRGKWCVFWLFLELCHDEEIFVPGFVVCNHAAYRICICLNLQKWLCRSFRMCR